MDTDFYIYNYELESNYPYYPTRETTTFGSIGDSKKLERIRLEKTIKVIHAKAVRAGI